MAAPDTTLSLDPRRRGRSGASGPEPYVQLALDCSRPLAGSTRYSLAHVDSVDFGRAPARSFRLVDEAGTRRMSIGLADDWISKTHARLSRVGDNWLIQDLHSKNGTVVNGSVVERALLAPGDVIELGRTLFLFGEVPATTEHAERVVDDTQLTAALPGLPTWLPALARAFSGLEAIAHSPVAVVIQGESGTGKELVARAIHQVSRRTGSMLALNCAAISEKLVESELFGYRKGAFTGADEDRPGVFRAADRGTLLLDEIGDLHEQAQAALLRVLQEQEVLPVGATRPIKVDVRVVAATQVALKDLVTQGRFRGDLYARLAGYVLEVPPLRDRREDLGLLIGTILRRLAPDRADRVTFSVPAARTLYAYRWPLNVRELEQALRAALVLSAGRSIELEHLPDDVRPAALGAAHPSDQTRKPARTEEDSGRREQLVDLLRQHFGNVSAVARTLGKTRAQVHRWIRHYALDVHGFRRR